MTIANYDTDNNTLHLIRQATKQAFVEVLKLWIVAPNLSHPLLFVIAVVVGAHWPLAAVLHGWRQSIHRTLLGRNRIAWPLDRAVLAEWNAGQREGDGATGGGRHETAAGTTR